MYKSLAVFQRSSQSAERPLWLSRLVFWAVAALISIHFSLSYAWVLPPGFPAGDFARGAVVYPFRRRVLMEWVYRLGLHWGDNLRYTSKNTSVDPATMIILLVAISSTLLAIFAARIFIAHLLGDESPFLWFSLLVVHIDNYHQLLIHLIRTQSPYDLPSVAFFGLACYAAYTRNRWLYYPVFMVATFNRESTLFLPLVFLIFGLETSVSIGEALRRFGVFKYFEIALQLVAWRGILGWCEYLTGGGGQSGHLFFLNLPLLKNPIHWSTYASVFGFLWIPYLLYFKRIENVRLQRCIWLAPLWAAVMIEYADPLEIRTNSEWTVYFTVCIALIVNNSWVKRRSPATSAAAPSLSPGRA